MLINADADISNEVTRLVGSTIFSFSTSTEDLKDLNEPEHHAFSPDGKRQLAKAHLPGSYR